MWKALFSNSAGSMSELAVFYHVASVLKCRSVGLGKESSKSSGKAKPMIFEMIAGKMWREVNVDGKRMVWHC